MNEVKDENKQNIYANYSLRDFSNHISEHIGYSNARKAILNLYSGEPYDYWVLIELSDCFSYIISHRAGVQFLYKILKKTKSPIKSIIENIHASFYQLLNFSTGCRIIYDYFNTFDEKGKIDIETECFRRLPDTRDPEFMNLLSMIIQAVPPDQRLLRPLLNISIYKNNPAAVNIGRTILEFCDLKMTIPLQNEITENLMSLLGDPVLHALIVSMIYSIPMQEKIVIYQTLYENFPAMVIHPFQWHIVHALLCVVPMKEKIQITQIISNAIINVTNSVYPQHIDGLIRCALELIDVKTRLEILKTVEFVYKNPNFPELTIYLDGLPVLLRSV